MADGLFAAPEASVAGGGQRAQNRAIGRRGTVLCDGPRSFPRGGRLFSGWFLTLDSAFFRHARRLVTPAARSDKRWEKDEPGLPQPDGGIARGPTAPRWRVCWPVP